MRRRLVAATLVFVVACTSSPTDPGFDIAYPGPEDVPPGERLGVVWTELSGNPRLAQPSCPAWHCLGHTDPWVAEGPDGQWVGWFSSGGDQGGPVVGRVVFDDEWIPELDPEDGPVLTLEEGVWNGYRETVSTWWDAETERWTMWYLGHETTFFEDAGFGQMRSTDRAGAMWERSDAPIYTPDPEGWDHAFITGPTFVETPEGEWRLYYSGAGTTVGVGVLVSEDQGESWTAHPENPVFERDLDGWDQGILEVGVLYSGGEYLMWYSGYEEPLDLADTPMYVGLARSPDGIEWERNDLNPVLGPGPTGSWNDLRVVSPHVVELDDGSFLLFAHGQGIGRTDEALGRIGVWRSVPD